MRAPAEATSTSTSDRLASQVSLCSVWGLTTDTSARTDRQTHQLSQNNVNHSVMSFHYDYKLIYVMINRICRLSIFSINMVIKGVAVKCNCLKQKLKMPVSIHN